MLHGNTLSFNGTDQAKENIHIAKRAELVVHTLMDVPSIGWLSEEGLCVDEQ